MHCTGQSSLNRYFSCVALLVFCLSPLFGLGNIIARNREIDNAGRMHQGRLDALSSSWHGAQRRVAGANEMLAASKINEATAATEASKVMAAKDVANKQVDLNRALQEAHDYEAHIAKQMDHYAPPRQNGRQTLLGIMVAMGLSAFVWRWSRVGDAASSRVPAYAQIMCVVISLAAASLVLGQTPVAPNTNTAAGNPLQPTGVLGDELGVYRTIEGFLSEGIKVETGTLNVDTVDGKKLDQPVSMVIRGAVIANHNVQPATLSLPPKKRCILKGYESGEMIGVPPAVSMAAKEQGWNDVPMSPQHWQWRSYFVALVVVEPKSIELRDPSVAGAQRVPPKAVDMPANGADPKSELPMLNQLPSLDALFKNPPRFKAHIICFNGKVDSRSSCSTTNFQPDGTLHATGKMTCGKAGQVSEVEWSFLERRGDSDVYRFTRRFPSDTATASTTTRDVEFSNGRVVVFEDEYQVIVIEPPK